MEEQTVTKFTKKMLSEKVFNCAVCDNLLTLPVMIVEHIGNVCHKCFETKHKEKGWTSLPNSNLNIMLKELSFPCKFTSEGCSVEAMYEDLSSHEDKCVYRTVSCLMPNGDCEWQGKLIDLSSHFKEEHSKHVVNGPDDVFSFDINPAKTTNMTKLLKSKNKAYILKIKELEEEGSVLHFIKDIKSTTENLDMVIKYKGRNGQYKVRSKRLPFNSGYEECNGTKIRILTLNEISPANEYIKVIIKPDKCEIENISGQVLKHLECPVCKDLMRPPIYQCSTGHSFCSSCRPNLSVCPTCRQPWSEARNFSLEGLTPSVLYSCMYSQFGCESSFPGNEINYHEGICEFKMYTCPISDCSFTGNFLSTKNHFKFNHSENLVESTVHRANFVEYHSTSRSNSHESQMYFFEHRNVYRLTFKRTSELCTWDVRILNKYNTNNKYYFVITITDPQREQRKIMQSNLCLQLETKISDYNVVSFSYDTLESYKNSRNNDILGYCCEIHEFKSDSNN